MRTTLNVAVIYLVRNSVPLLNQSCKLIRMASTIPAIKLLDGREMPVLGLGTYARNGKPEQYIQAVEWGIEAGYRHIDTASSYKNEVEVGQGLHNMIQKGLVSRDDLFVTTKLWNDKHAEKDVVPTLKESLSKLKLDYVDLYLIHWPFSVDLVGAEANIDYLETWKGMEQAVKLGLTKSIGIANFNKEQLTRLYNNADIKPVVNQIEINPTLTQHELVDHCKSLSVIPVAYTPLGLISEARPEFIGKDTIKTDAKFAGIAKKYGKSLAQIALRYLVQRGVAAIPKSFTKSRIEENLNVFDFVLEDHEMAIVDSFNIDQRCVPATAFKHLNNYPF